MKRSSSGDDVEVDVSPSLSVMLRSGVAAALSLLTIAYIGVLRNEAMMGLARLALD